MLTNKKIKQDAKSSSAKSIGLLHRLTIFENVISEFRRARMVNVI